MALFSMIKEAFGKGSKDRTAGEALPETVETNDDPVPCGEPEGPIYEYIKKHSRF